MHLSEIFSTKTYVVTHCLGNMILIKSHKMILMRDHSIYFYGKMWKIIPKASVTPSDLGPVVQSIIGLTSSLRGQLVKCFTTL